MKNYLYVLLLFLMVLSCKEKEEVQVLETSEELTKTKVVEKIVIDTVLVKELDLKPSAKEQIKDLKEKGFMIFDYVDEKTQDTVIMQQYFMAFLKKGPIRGQNEEEAAHLQKAHRAHLGKMYELGYADISGPFGDDGDIRGITIYNVPTLKMADSLANSDPMVKAGRLEIEIRPWWAGKGYPLR